MDYASDGINSVQNICVDSVIISICNPHDLCALTVNYIVIKCAYLI